MSSGQQAPSSGRLFYGWRMVAAGGTLRFLAGGLHILGFSIFFLPISRDLGLSRAATSLIFSLARAEGAFEGPLAGYAIDRFGPRVVMVIGSLLVGVGYLLFSQAGSFGVLLLAYVLVVTPGSGAGFMHAPLALANNWFIRRRAMAMALTSSAIPMGGALLTPALTTAIYGLGWRWAAALVGVVFLAVALPVARAVRNRPESMGLVPLGQAPEASPPGRTALPALVQSQLPDYSVGKAMRTVTFWTLVVATILRQAGFSAIMLHFVPILVWKGLDERTAAFYVAPMSLLSVLAHLCMGWLADRWPKPRVLALGVALGSLSLVVLLVGSAGTAWLFLPFFVAIEGSFPVTWAAVGEFFGRGHFATVRGFVTMFTMVGPVVAPVLAGRLYDTSGSYALAIQMALVGFVLSSVTFWMVRHPQHQPTAQAAQT